MMIPSCKLFLESEILIGLLNIPAIFRQTTVCKVIVQNVSLSVGTSVQVTVVWLEVVGQLPQCDARML